MTDLVTIGWLTVDDIVLEDGTCSMGVSGGGALYSAIGAHIWAPSVGLHAAAGRPYAEMIRRGVASRGLDTRGISEADGNGLELWLLHESDDRKQQIPKLSSSPALAMDATRGDLPEAYARAAGYHIAPQGPESSVENARFLKDREAVVTMDILADEMIDADHYADLAFLRCLTAFLPSEAEIQRLWRPAAIEGWLAENARQHGCHMVGKIGSEGSILAEAGSGALTFVPALGVAARDTTGAGDAYCGGFLAGLTQRRPLGECGAMGTVSAAYVVEACGALATATPSRAERDTRLAQVLGGLGRLTS